MQELARRLESGWSPERDDPFSAPRAIRSLQGKVIDHVGDEMLKRAAQGEENLHLPRRIGSLIVAPLPARGEVLGALSTSRHDPAQRKVNERVASTPASVAFRLDRRFTSRVGKAGCETEV